MNQAQLGAEMAKYRPSWSRSTVVKLENRKRESVSVEDLLALAYVLKVSPLLLLLPVENGDYPVAGDVTTTARAVYEWLVGERLPPLPTEQEQVEWTDEDRAFAWFVFTRAISYVPEPSAHWLVNAELERLKDHERRDPAIVAEMRQEFQMAVAEDLRRLSTEISALRDQLVEARGDAIAASLDQRGVRD